MQAQVLSFVDQLVIYSANFIQIDPKKAERRDGKMFLGGVKPDTPDDAIKSYFQQFGEVRKVYAKN